MTLQDEQDAQHRLERYRTFQRSVANDVIDNSPQEQERRDLEEHDGVGALIWIFVSAIAIFVLALAFGYAKEWRL